MNPITVFIFRILLIVGGVILLYITGKPALESVQYLLYGEKAEGVVVGFRGRKNSTTIFTENTSKVGKKYIPRRPVYRYPIAPGSLDSLDGFARTTVLLPWLNFHLQDKVTVVMDKTNPSRSHIISPGIFFTDVLVTLLCLFMVKLGFTRPEP